tara:strand:- start:528 stop:1334 length:807 start_codon:yes stop_codon:yes gene_type:complete
MKKIYLLIFVVLTNSFLFGQQTDFISTSVNQSKLDSVINYKWQIGASVMFNEQRSGIYQNKFVDISNLKSGFNISVSRKLNTHLVSLNFNKINLNYSFSDTLNNSPNVYDPWKFYEYKGYTSSSELLALNLKASLDLEKLFNFDFDTYINKVSKSKKINDIIDLYFDVGLGLTYFSSISRNLVSDDFIYSYGYKDLEGSPEELKSIIDRPKSNIFLLGYTLKYNVKPNISYFFSWEEAFVDTDMLDGISNSTKRDRYRSLHLGVNYMF